jgi:hypothetical protein
MDAYIYIFGWGEADVEDKTMTVSGSRLINVKGKVELRGHLLVYLAERVAQ